MLVYSCEVNLTNTISVKLKLKRQPEVVETQRSGGKLEAILNVYSKYD